PQAVGRDLHFAHRVLLDAMFHRAPSGPRPDCSQGTRSGHLRATEAGNSPGTTAIYRVGFLDVCG
ncbi:MAG: hypothetical protein AAEJ65_10420, partial [Planctomycetota bacterium]